MKSFMTFAAVLFLIQFEFSCKRKTDAQFIFSEYKISDTFQHAKNQRPDSIIYSKGYKAYLKYDKRGNLSKIYGTLGSPDTAISYGHIFIIDTVGTSNNYGRLISYEYIGVNFFPYSYAVKFNPKTKKYTEIFSPFLGYSIYNFSDKDSILKYTLDFSIFPRSNVYASYSFDNKSYKELPLHKSNYMPYLDEVDLKINRNVNYILLKTEAKDLRLDLPGLSNTRTFFDTVKLYKALTTF